MLAKRPKFIASLSTDLAQAMSGISVRPGRSILTSLGTMVGVGALVATLGLTTTISAQISGRFDALRATEVRVEPTGENTTSAFPIDTDDRLLRLNGVVSGGLVQPYGDKSVELIAGRSSNQTATVLSATPGALRAALPKLSSGRLFDAIHDDRSDRVAVIGRAVAGRLGVIGVAPPKVVYVDGIPFAVIGILDDVARNADMLSSIVVPRTAAADVWPAAVSTPYVLIDVQPGAAQMIGRQVPIALRPDNPDSLRALVPPDPQTLRMAVENDTRTLFLGLAVVALSIGALSIATTTLVSVLERRCEIGLRRAVGATRTDVALQFLGESAALGTFGGLAGTSLGVLAVVVTSINQGWSAVLEPTYTLPAPLLGTITGALAGLYPASRASRLQPVEALRA